MPKTNYLRKYIFSGIKYNNDNEFILSYISESENYYSIRKIGISEKNNKPTFVVKNKYIPAYGDSN